MCQAFVDAGMMCYFQQSGERSNILEYYGLRGGFRIKLQKMNINQQ